MSLTIYACLIASAVSVGLTAVIALFLAWTGRLLVQGWTRSHLLYQLRTSLIGVISGVIGVLTLPLGLGVFILSLTVIWVVARGAAGLLILLRREQIRDPKTWKLPATDPRDHDLVAEEGRPAAAVVWLLYVLSIPSVGTLAVIGLMVAYVARDSGRGWVRSHFDQQIRIFWQSFWWHILPWIVAAGVAFFFGPFGLIALVLPLLVNLILLVWFTIKSVFGLIALVQAKPVS